MEKYLHYDPIKTLVKKTGIPIYIPSLWEAPKLDSGSGSDRKTPVSHTIAYISFARWGKQSEPVPEAAPVSDDEMEGTKR